MGEDTPPLSVVHNNQPTEFTKEEQMVAQALRVLVANVLRVVRGTGRPWSIVSEVAEFLNFVVNYEKAAGHNLDSTFLANELCILHEPGYALDLGLNEFNCAMDHHEERMLRGALQIAASRLIHQKTQERSGESDLCLGSNDRQLELIKLHRGDYE